MFHKFRKNLEKLLKENQINFGFVIKSISLLYSRRLLPTAQSVS